jgi:CheY-like chemotaxis protein
MATASLRVLLAEREYSETGLTLRSLCAEAGWSLELAFVSSRSNLAQALLAHCPDVAFLQLGLLQPDAPDRLRVLHLSYPSIPFILFADPADTDCAVSCLSMGAEDFMLEGFMDERTMARVLGSIMGRKPPERCNSFVVGPASAGSTYALASVGCAAFDFTREVRKHDLALSVCIEQSEPVAARTSSELLELLRSCIRSTDLLVSNSPGNFILYFTGIAEAAASTILHRVQRKLESLGMSLPSPSNAALRVTVAAKLPYSRSVTQPF